MKLSLAWAAAIAVVVAACATTDATGDAVLHEDNVTPSTPLPSDDAGSAIGQDAGIDGSPDGSTPIDQSVCGDAKKAANEECDDGNNADGDGCSASCKNESAAPEDLCPGTEIVLTGAGSSPRKGSVSGNTSQVYGHYSSTCGGATGRDAVYMVKPDVTGILKAKLTSSFDSVFYARRSCDETKTEVSCNDAPGSAGGEQLSVPVTKDQPVFLFVDGYSGSTGTFTIEIEVATAFCGNGVAELPEACDDGNSVAGDGCAPDCTFEAGGDITDCPGQGILLKGTGNAERKVSFAGTTTGLPSSTLTAASCSSSGPNAVYAITPDTDGALTATMVATFDNAALHIRSECDTNSSETQLDCRESTEPLEPLVLTVPVKAGLPYYIIADSSSSTYAGPYTLDIVVRPGACGNKILEGSEECDDGNTASGDGCTSTCTLEPISASIDTCPGAPLPLAAAAGGTYTGIVTSSTATLNKDYKPKSTSCSSTDAKDAVFNVTSPINGLLEATVVGAFDTLLYARSTCGPDGAVTADLGCSGIVDGNGPEKISIPVLANQPAYIIVDSEVFAAGGVFELDVVVKPGACGNGVLEGGEQCDDTNTADNDGCSATCQLEPATTRDTCANAEAISLSAASGGTYTATVASGTTNLAHDQTFSGCSSAGPDAMFKVTAPIDGVLTASVPSASFNLSLGARTSSTCPTSTTATLPIVCSNVSSDNGLEEITFSVTKGETYYLIVDGISSTQKGTFTMLVDVRPPGCGDGLMSGGESCDDGNTADGDGCSSTCTIQPLVGIDTCPGYAMTLSGTGTDPRTGVLTVDTSVLTPNYAGSCSGSSKDGVVVVTPPINGKLTVKVTGLDYQPVIYARTTCNDPKTQKACDDDQPNPSTMGRDFTITGVVAGTPYYLFIDGYNGGAGKARLNVTVTP